MLGKKNRILGRRNDKLLSGVNITCIPQL